MKSRYYKSNPWQAKPNRLYEQKQKKAMKRLGMKSRLFNKKAEKAAAESEDEHEPEINEKVYKYREGACENCGAMTHLKKQCVERPRKFGAKYRAQNIMPDETIKKVRTGFDAKRDNWESYDPSNHTELVKVYELEQEVKKELKIDKGELEYKHALEDNAHYLDKDDDTKEKNYHSLRQRGDIPSYIKEISKAKPGESEKEKRRAEK